MQDRGYRAETNHHEEMEMSIEMSEIISQALNRLYAKLLLGMRIYTTNLRGYKRKHDMSLFTKNLIILLRRKYVSP